VRSKPSYFSVPVFFTSTWASSFSHDSVVLRSCHLRAYSANIFIVYVTTFLVRWAYHESIIKTGLPDVAHALTAHKNEKQI
jgi:hypothetical protein